MGFLSKKSKKKSGKKGAPKGKGRGRPSNLATDGTPGRFFVTKAKNPTHAVFGTTTDGEVFSMPISTAPHMLVAGQTGSGKSVAVNSLNVSMMAHSHPSELEIFWIDPKGVEAAPYVDLPFCPIPPIVDMNSAFGFISYLEWLMDERYKKFRFLKLKNIDEYVEWYSKNPDKAKEYGFEKMAYIVCVIDEYADLTMTNKEVEQPIVRLGQKARASGIHLIIATQRPSADIVTPILRDNIPTRVGLRVNSPSSSGIIMGGSDEADCSTLKGYGDAYIKDAMGSVTRVQFPYVSNDEIARIFGALRERFKDYSPPPLDYKSKVVEIGKCEWANAEVDDPNNPGEMVTVEVGTPEYEALPIDLKVVKPAKRGYGRF